MLHAGKHPIRVAVGTVNWQPIPMYRFFAVYDPQHCICQNSNAFRRRVLNPPCIPFHHRCQNTLCFDAFAYTILVRILPPPGGYNISPPGFEPGLRRFTAWRATITPREANPKRIGFVAERNLKRFFIIFDCWTFLGT